MKAPAIFLTTLLLFGSGCASNSVTAPMTSQNRQALQAVVVATEQAFARSMAQRDFEAFKFFLSDQAIFISSPKPLYGKEQVLKAWKEYFNGAEAPFSWEPERVEVLESGDLAFSTGPVRAPDGKTIGVFNSVWQLQNDGRWQIIFDKGGCNCQRAIADQ